MRNEFNCIFLRVEAQLATHIRQVAIEMRELSKNLGQVPIVCKFNDKEIWVEWNSNIDRVVEKYHETPSHKQEQ
jgi:hypothetical protein